MAESALRAPAASYAEVEFYPELAEKAAILFSRLVRNHPLPDGNKRVAFVCMIEFLERNGYSLGADADPDATVDTLVAVASDIAKERDFVTWVRDRLVPFGG